MTNPKTAKLAFLSAILIYGTLGVFVRYAGQPSALVALARSSIGTLFLLLLLAVKRQKIDFAAIRRNWRPLLIAGVLLGLNWVTLFEAYRYTTVAVATLCTYLNPIIIVFGAAVLMHEQLTARKLLCIAVALIGMVFVSGVADSGLPDAGEAKGILLGLLVKKQRVTASRGEKISLDRFFLKKGTYAFIGLVLMAFVYGLLVNYLSVFARERHVMANPGYFFLLMSLGLILSRLFAGGMIDKGYIGRLILGGKGTILLASLLFLFVPTETVFFGSAVAFGLGFGMMSPSYQTLFINLAEPTRRGTANATYLIAWDVGIGAAVLLGGLIAEISSFDDAFILGLIMLFFSAVLYMKVIGPQYEKNRLR